ncbi:Aminomethyltransferase folate-binding domain-containing protein [Microthyrium microscopicum]|uniref:Iron-sulfur cluster assembly factor IBA57 homolog, mitochondrial n=1 Tax=Microthyrium microscopicum TaxID=703497 RepID=A0A6A6U1R7_9PEZI|nr:Aminomethyltransferase folate-binding domain-containing protein [Microthyrium microscopicum]
MSNLHVLKRQSFRLLSTSRFPIASVSNPAFSTRNASTGTPIASAGIAPLPNRSLIHISGRDAPKFLQGLTTNNVDTSRLHGWYTAFLNATGRVVTDAFVWPVIKDVDWACLLDVDETVAQRLQSYLKKHKLRSKVSIRVLEGSQQKTLGYLPDPRLAGFSHRLILPKNAEPESSLTNILQPFSQLQLATAKQYDLHRYINGVPEGPIEMFSEHYQVHPSNLDVLNAVDFHKGCYVGQELTIRTEHTGVVRKRILPIQLYPTNSSAPDQLTYSPDVMDFDSSTIPHETKIVSTGGKREAAKWIAGTGNVGLAMCRIETMTDVKVSAEGGTYTESAEFFLSEDTGLKVKAFVPNWLRQQLSMARKPRS